MSTKAKTLNSSMVKGKASLPFTCAQAKPMSETGSCVPVSRFAFLSTGLPLQNCVRGMKH